MPDATAPDLARALRDELRAAQPDLAAGGAAAARALHSLHAAAAVAGDEALRGALRTAQALHDTAPGPETLQAELRRLGLLPPETQPADTPGPQKSDSDTPKPDSPSPDSSSPDAAPGLHSPDPPATVRVDVRKLDALLALAGELTSARLQLNERLGRARSGEGGAWRDVRAAQQTLATLTDDLAREVLAARLEPARPFLQSFERAARDAARQAGKRARLHVDAADAELDRHAMDRLRSPLLHLIRNAVDHGIDLPGARAARGVDDTGTVTLSAYSAAGQVTVTVHDDGPGVDYAEIARAAGRPYARGDAALDAELTELLFTPGFTSRQEVTDLSGRGVGLDVVRTQARALGGDVSLRSGPRGTTVTVQFPLTLATTRVAVVRASGQLLGVPVRWVDRAGRAQVHPHEGRPAVRIGGRVVPAASLAGALNLGASRDGAYLLVRQGEAHLALLVDALVGEEELVIKPLAFPLAGAPHLEGAAQLPDGQIVPVLNVRALRPPAVSAEAAPLRAPRVLLAEDTAVTRQLLRGILSGAGFEVTAVENGALAWEAALRGAPDLLLTDVEMPQLGGLDLTRQVRAHPQLQHLPVVLLTSLARPEDREQGAEAGADAYLVKGEFDEAALLATLRRLL
ncbi:response regulator [Deinococcus sp. JMULE3]|uniref:hybrid sensor histidine kinase/response regulator n=1 Tax=Deinococcus sp. JMULE3 TaxID=2518341 RepID=UPI001574F749|nr:response regulator [Deinococcus sp. JMULE3]NTY02567.1 hybrid sensor histidine kinase/response regulator [Deinococcus sp. JMULE3]